MARLLRLLAISLALTVLLMGGAAAGPGHNSAGMDGDPETPMLTHPGGKIPGVVKRDGAEGASEPVRSDSRDPWEILLRAYLRLVRIGIL